MGSGAAVDGRPFCSHGQTRSEGWGQHAASLAEPPAAHTPTCCGVWVGGGDVVLAAADLTLLRHALPPARPYLQGDRRQVDQSVRCGDAQVVVKRSSAASCMHHSRHVTERQQTRQGGGRKQRQLTP